MRSLWRASTVCLVSLLISVPLAGQEAESQPTGTTIHNQHVMRPSGPPLMGCRSGRIRR